MKNMNSIINLDYQNRTPIYEQIINEFERYVALGILKPKEQIPSIRELASTLGINPNTVKKAYEKLEAKGIIQTVSTKGTFISDHVDNVASEKIANEIELISKRISELEKLGISRKEILERLK